MHRNDREPRGLINLGNTCFLNSALQALAACRPLLLHIEHSAALLELPSTHKKGERLTAAFAKLLRELHTRQACAPPLQPSDLVALARTLTPALEGAGQQDVEEFLNALLNGMHEHLKRPLGERELVDLRSRLAARWRRVTGQDWRDEAQLAYEVAGPTPHSHTPVLTRESREPKRPCTLRLSDATVLRLSLFYRLQAQLNAMRGTGRSRHAVPPPPRPHTSMLCDLFGGELLSGVTCVTCRRAELN